MPTTRLLGSAWTLVRDVAPWALLLLGGVVIGTVVIIFARRLLHGDGGAGAGPPLTLQDLREMRNRGDLSDEEFQRIRDRMVERWRSENKPSDST